MNDLTDKIKEERAEERQKAKTFPTFLREEGGMIPRLAAVTLGVLFVRYHLVFGAFPLGIALVSSVPTLVWSSLIGVAAGSLSLGTEGIVYAFCALAAVAVRLFCSRGHEDSEPFKESILLRMCASVISGFVAAVYHVITQGFVMNTIFTSLALILLPPVLVFVFSGLFSENVSLINVLSGKCDLSLAKKSDKEKYELIFFQCSALVTLFLISLSLSEISLFGISGNFIFISIATLLIAKKFGAPRAMAAGFFSALGSSSVAAVAFALVGLISGLIFPFGASSALISAGAGAALWSFYSLGAEGIFTVLPEYVISATIASPILRGITKTKTDAAAERSAKNAEDIAGIFALSYRGRKRDKLDNLESALNSLSSTLRAYNKSDGPTEEDLQNLILDTLSDFCGECGEFDFCKKEDVFPAKKNAEKLAKKLARGEKITSADINTGTEFCSTPEQVAEAINMGAARLSREHFLLRRMGTGADQYDLVGKLISEARLCDLREGGQDLSLSERLTKELQKCGFPTAIAKVFGERKKHFIIAMEDEDGSEITRPEILRKVEELCGAKLSPPEFYKKDGCAILECGVKRSFAVEIAFASASGSGEISGDSLSTFESPDDRFFAICSDGMGSGDQARETSDFSCKFLRGALSAGSPETALHLLNSTLRARSVECSATADIFSLDLLDGSATFIKSGAAPSFIKRNSSIFRIKSSTAPLGLMKTIDSERIQAEVKGGDYVIMLSDGVSTVAEESPWLLELLTRPSKDSARAYADYILAAAKENSRSHDDMSLIVMKIIKLC